jgi:hypothetical protein
MCYLINVNERKRKMRDKMGAISKRINAAQKAQSTQTLKNNDLIVSVQREFINASDFNSIDEYRAAVKARRAAIEAHNARIRELGR